jgi:hypothetical protein
MLPGPAPSASGAAGSRTGTAAAIAGCGAGAGRGAGGGESLSRAPRDRANASSFVARRGRPEGRSSVWSGGMASEMSRLHHSWGCRNAPPWRPQPSGPMVVSRHRRQEVASTWRPCPSARTGARSAPPAHRCPPASASR